jgi:hypothetical protein
MTFVDFSCRPAVAALVRNAVRDRGTCADSLALLPLGGVALFMLQQSECEAFIEAAERLLRETDERLRDMRHTSEMTSGKPEFRR